jgi:hypothetical protein
MDHLEKQTLVITHKALITLLPRDLKRLQIDNIKPCGRKSFNPGKRVEFNVYSICDVLYHLFKETDVSTSTELLGNNIEIDNFVVI